jgi:5'-deoxynucleotidase YfbR-like HD superfamily hydrolase
MKPITHVEDLLDGGHIERYHIKGQRMLTRQCVAEHSWRMAAVLFNIWPEASVQLVWATLFHDVSERVTGDMPANIKRANPAVAAAVHDLSEQEERRLGIRFPLDEEEGKLLGWLDRYEGALHCLDELEMGNRKVIVTLNRYIMYAGDPKYVLRDYGREARRSQLLENLRIKAHSLINHEEPQL